MAKRRGRPRRPKLNEKLEDETEKVSPSESDETHFSRHNKKLASDKAELKTLRETVKKSWYELKPAIDARGASFYKLVFRVKDGLGNVSSVYVGSTKRQATKDYIETLRKQGKL